MAYSVKQISDEYAVLGEGPHWDIETQSLYFNDIYGGTIHRYDYAKNKTFSAKIEGEPVISFIIPVEDHNDKYAVGIGRRVGIIHWNGISNNATLERIVFEVEKSEEYNNNRFNDAKADPKGRFFGGTMRLEEMGDIFEKRLGNFYTYNGTVKKIFDKIGVSNGITWNEDCNKMYYIDSIDLNVKEFDYDFDLGTIGKSEVVIDFSKNGKNPGFVPDGMTIDADGYLYVATFGGSRIFKIDPKNKEIEMEIKFPCEQITSCAWGGPKLDILFVTSASVKDKPKPAGATFMVTGLKTTGTKMYKVKF